MRPVSVADIEFATRAVIAVPECERATMARRLVGQAFEADRFRQKTGRAHPVWGAGSLMSAALAHPQAKRAGCLNDDWLAAMACVLSALADAPDHHEC